MNEDETLCSGVNLADEVILEESYGSFPVDLFTALPNRAR